METFRFRVRANPGAGEVTPPSSDEVALAAAVPRFSPLPCGFLRFLSGVCVVLWWRTDDGFAFL